MKKSGLAVFLSLSFIAGLFFTKKGYADNFSGDWEKKDKDWYFFLGPNRPLEDEWLDYNGASYFIGKGGKMVTGRYLDPEDKAEYFFDDDGRLLVDAFSKDGTLYIGKNGKELRYFNDYRAFLRTELTSLKQKDFGKKTEVASGGAESTATSLEGKVIHPEAYALLDINGDGYKDILLLKDKVGAEAKLSPNVLAVILYKEEMHVTRESREEEKNKTENEKIPIKERSLTPLLEAEADGSYNFVVRRDNLTGEPAFLRNNWGGGDYAVFQYKKNEGLTSPYSITVKRDALGSAQYYAFADEVDFTDYQSVLQTIQNRFGEPYPIKSYNLDEDGLREGLKDFTQDELSFFASQEFNN